MLLVSMLLLQNSEITKFDEENGNLYNSNTEIVCNFMQTISDSFF